MDTPPIAMRRPLPAFQVRDLTTLLTLPFVWRALAPERICDDLLEVVRTTFGADRARIVVEREGHDRIERIRPAEQSPRGACSLLVDREGVRLTFTCDAPREGFPTPADRALLGAALDQAWLSIRSADLLGSHRDARARAEAHAAHLRGLMDASLTLVSDAPLDVLLQRVTNEARTIIGAHEAVTSLVPRGSWSRALHAISVSDRPRAAPAAVPDGTGVEADVCRDRRPRREVGSDGRGWLAAPLIGRDGRSLGLVRLSDKQHGEFDEHDEAIAVQLARIASAAIEAAGLREDLGEAFRREREAREESERANRSKDDFLAILSHELRTPLNAIQGWAALLKAGSVPPERQRRALETIERNTRAQARLVDELLDLSRIVHGKIVLDDEVIDAGSLVAMVVESLRLTAEQKRVALAFSDATSGGDASVRGDPSRLQQVVSNLIGNALKFTRAGGRVDVTLAVEAGWVVIDVADSGEGITPDQLAQVFEPFHQAAGGTARSHGGLGLGLAIVKRLVELHGGDVSATSGGTGMGASFAVRLPRIVRQGLAPGVAHAERPRDDLEGVLVLVIDDHDDSRELVASVLEARGARARVAASADGGLALARAERFDVVLCDIAMPERDGFSFLRALRAQPEIASTPVIALTAFASADDRARISAGGFDGHVAKPVDVETLSSVVSTSRRRR